MLSLSLAHSGSRAEASKSALQTRAPSEKRAALTRQPSRLHTTLNSRWWWRRATCREAAPGAGSSEPRICPAPGEPRPLESPAPWRAPPPGSPAPSLPADEAPEQWSCLVEPVLERELIPLHYEISNRAFFLLLNQSRPGSNGTSSTRQKDPCWGPTGEGR